ncbi:multidrug resistance protein homolog 49-like [Lucilia sericata]|uniref:multidrug resistance protein homolog 49-like n=1 Tax=Lucilia sericata TaxID=13632 RepID=UPI0018A84422|nr:multidrug resistance protein homolog 49-like [Lucilia sericata]
MGQESPSKTKKKPKVVQREVGFFELFCFATRWEYFLLVLAFIAAFLKSLVFPIIIVVYSELVSMFVDRSLCLPTTPTYTLPLFGGGKILTYSFPERTSWGKNHHQKLRKNQKWFKEK